MEEMDGGGGARSAGGGEGGQWTAKELEVRGRRPGIGGRGARKVDSLGARNSATGIR